MRMAGLRLPEVMNKMFYSIISEYDVFFSQSDSDFREKRSGGGVMTMIKRDGKYQPYSFFSTNPRDYLKTENQITPFYY